MTRYLSVCSGLEGASLAVRGLGWSAVGFAEIEAFPSALLAQRFGSNLPGEPLSGNAPPNFGDFTAIDLAALGAVDVLIGGTPCQAFSVAGKRLSLADARGNLTLAYAVLAHELARSHGLRNALWENVPGVLSAKDNAFGCFLGALVGTGAAVVRPGGGGWPDAGMVCGPRARAAWRVLDAQYFGVAQRRERVFVVADFGDGADPAAVLFEPQGLRGNSAPRRETGEGIAGTLAASAGGCDENDAADGRLVAFGGNRTAGPLDVATAVNAHGGPHGRQDFGSETFVACEVADSLTVGANQTTGFVGDVIAHSLRGGGFDASEGGTGRGTPIVPVAFGGQMSAPQWDFDLSQTLQAPNPQVVAFDLRGREGGAQFAGTHDTANIRAASGGSSRSYLADRVAVRRLTPTECERLQGVPDGYTRIPWRGKGAEACPDGPRYKALGNSWAVPVVAWIAARLDAGLAGRAP